jgi:phage protein D
MILKDAYKDAPIIEIQVIGGTVSTNDIVATEIVFSENKHDVATLTYSGFPPSAVTTYSGLPVFIRFGNNEANIQEFHGYVAYVEANSITRMGTVNRSRIQEAKVVCFGVSYTMKPISSTAYKNITLPKLVSTIAKKYNFSYSVPSNNFVIPTVDQSSKSDWEVLTNTANKLGYYVTATNTHITVYDPLSSFYRGLTPTTLNTLQAEGGAQRKPGNVLEFKGTFGDVTPYGSSHNYVIKTLDDKGKSVEYSTKNNAGSGMGKQVTRRFTQEITMNAVSKEALKNYADGYMKQAIPLHADVTISGISTVFPGALVYLNNYNSEYDGYWVVEEARHLINRDHYVTYLHIKTDSTNNTKINKGSGNKYVKYPGSVLRNGNWVTKKEFKYVY